MTECEEIAANMPLPADRILTSDDAMAIVKRDMPDETFTIRSNVAEALVARQRRLRIGWARLPR